ncbi:hypothetical protein M885DRAFT_518452 [Pelagophyceae sp. CCMP2097]|nr:hypothetical protein M885DRAFT_518452 [Pelagophyceae sp. CCMP2097]
MQLGRAATKLARGEGNGVSDAAVPSAPLRPKAQPEPPAPKIFLSVLFYCLCSSSLLFLNKYAVGTLGLRPGAVVVLQLSFASATCLLLRACNLCSIGQCEARKLRLFGLYVFAFVGSIYSSVMALRHSNVETFIVFRAATPIAVCALDWLFLGRAVPGWKSIAALGGTALAAGGYVFTDAQFLVEGAAGYTWCAVYFVLICFEMTFGKHLVSSVRAGVWESVFLTNTLALPLLCAVAAARGELDDLPQQLKGLSAGGATVFFLSCLVATLIGYSGWVCRSLVSATAYTLIGVANKLGTVLLAVAFLEKHATPAGAAALLACIACSSAYKQPPMRDDLVAKVEPQLKPISEAALESQDESELLLAAAAETTRALAAAPANCAIS